MYILLSIHLREDVGHLKKPTWPERRWGRACHFLAWRSRSHSPFGIEVGTRGRKAVGRTGGRKSARIPSLSVGVVWWKRGRPPHGIYGRSQRKGFCRCYCNYNSVWLQKWWHWWLQCREREGGVRAVICEADYSRYVEKKHVGGKSARGSNRNVRLRNGIRAFPGMYKRSNATCLMEDERM